MTQKIEIFTERASSPVAAYSQGVRHGESIYLSGQVPVDPETGEVTHPGDVTFQTLQVLENIRSLVEAAGASFNDVVMLHVYLASRDDFSTMNTTYATYVTQHTPNGVLPARTTTITGLPLEGVLVEIEATVMQRRQSSDGKGHRL
jgi:reactive intermediate/imine deaminase